MTTPPPGNSKGKQPGNRLDAAPPNVVKRRGPKRLSTKQTATRLKAAEKRRQATELRIAGLTFQEIARRVGYANKGTVCRVVNEQLTEYDAINTEVRERYRWEQIARCQQRIVGSWANARRGDKDADQIVDRAMRMMNELLGLTTNKVDMTVTTVEDINADIAAELAAFASGAATARSMGIADPDGAGNIPPEPPRTPPGDAPPPTP